jgi:hypothetical protein
VCIGRGRGKKKRKRKEKKETAIFIQAKIPVQNYFTLLSLKFKPSFSLVLPKLR